MLPGHSNMEVTELWFCMKTLIHPARVMPTCIHRHSQNSVSIIPEPTRPDFFLQLEHLLDPQRYSILSHLCSGPLSSEMKKVY